VPAFDAVRAESSNSAASNGEQTNRTPHRLRRLKAAAGFRCLFFSCVNRIAAPRVTSPVDRNAVQELRFSPGLRLSISVYWRGGKTPMPLNMVHDRVLHHADTGRPQLPIHNPHQRSHTQIAVVPRIQLSIAFRGACLRAPLARAACARWPSSVSTMPWPVFGRDNGNRLSKASMPITSSICSATRHSLNCRQVDLS